jgi:selenocysteine lyase/cysteine desulfurase
MASRFDKLDELACGNPQTRRRSPSSIALALRPSGRNRELVEILRASLSEAGLGAGRSSRGQSHTIASVPLGDADPADLVEEFKRRDIICAARDGQWRLAIHFYNGEDDIAPLASALSELWAC